MRQLVNPKTFGRPTISLALFGCANRPFYQIAVFPDKALGRKYEGNIIEQIGTFDPLPNDRNEKLVSLDIHRVKYWIGERNAHVTVAALELLGLAGLLPLHPKTFIRAQKNSALLQHLHEKYKPKAVTSAIDAESSSTSAQSPSSSSSQDAESQGERAVAFN